jgi:hypothetical protein
MTERQTKLLILLLTASIVFISIISMRHEDRANYWEKKYHELERRYVLDPK